MGTKLKYTVQLNGEEDENGWQDIIVNLPVGLTIQNRKLHRSCMSYQVNGGYIYDTNNEVQVKIGTAPDTWPVRASIRRARDHWLKMHKEIFSLNPNLKPKWHDFKMMLTKSQATGFATTYNVPEDIFDNNLNHNDAGITWSVYTTEDGTGTPVINSVGGSVGIPDTDKDEFTAHLLGTHDADNFGTTSQQIRSIGALYSWMSSRPDLSHVEHINYNEDDRIANDPLNLLFNDGDADNEIIDNFTNAESGDGNQEGDAYPPYNITAPVDSVMEVAAARCSSAAPISYFTGFTALLGQVFLRVKAQGKGRMDILLDVEPKGMKI